MPERMEFWKPTRGRRRATRANAYRQGYGGKAWHSMRLRVLARDNWQCQTCGRVCSDPKEAHVDHKIPKRLQDGEDREELLWTLCIRCHAKKTNLEKKGMG